MKNIRYAIPLVAMMISVLWMGLALGEQDRRIEDLEHRLALARYTAEARQHLLEEARELQTALERQRLVRTLTVTAYNPEEEQCDEDPYVAASMRRVRQGTIAVSRDLFDAGWVFGRKVRIEGLGIFEINDLMNSRYKDRVDIFMWDKSAAQAFGRRQVRVALLDI